ncbi:MAG TPA: CYTH and CHAD domain-containing protein [Acidimicrobiia bacterium]
MRERELKFMPGPLFAVPDLTDLAPGTRADEPDTIRLHAAYFDTDDLRLARSGASLRYRDDEGWMVKLPVAADDALIRQELRVDGDAADPPEAALDLVHALIRREPVQFIARLNTVRQRTVVRSAGGEQLAELVDDEVSVLDGARLTARFRELEVELAENVPEDLVRELKHRLHAAGSGHTDLVPKIVRALGPRASDPPDVAPPPRLDFASTPLEVLRSAVASSTARLVAHDPGVRIGTDPEDVHQARVATRRLRSDLRSFRDVVDPEWSAASSDELKWIGGLLGAVRDTDVLLERLEGRLEQLSKPELDAGKQLLAGLRDHREQARDELLAAMRADRYLQLLDRLVDATHVIPPEDEALCDDIELTDVVRKPWRKLRDAAEAVNPDSPDPVLHAVRIRAKRCRYAAEAVAPALGKPARRFASAIARVQEVLGEHQDAVVAEQWLRAHARGEGSNVERAFVAGELAALERVAAAESRAQFPQTWKAARHKRLRDWL